MRAICLLLVLLGCSGDKDKSGAGSADDTGSTSADDTGSHDEVVSSFNSGQYRAYYFQILPDLDDGGEPQGLDLNDDGTVDNKLPSVLPAVVAISGNDTLSIDGLNLSISDAMAADELIMLLEAVHKGGDLRLDVLLGSIDEDDSLGVDDASYGADGIPQARLEGVFSSEKRFKVTSDRIEIPVIFDPTVPPVLLPLAMARVEGTLEDDASQGTLGGAIPIEDLVTQVLEPLLPPEGEYDPADYAGMERDELLDTVRTLGNENMADIELEDGTMAISAALIYGADSASW